MQGLHAQTKLKAYSIGEIEPIAGATVSPAYIEAARRALADAGGRSMGTVEFSTPRAGLLPSVWL
jgi:hypothetical protein